MGSLGADLEGSAMMSCLRWLSTCVWNIAVCTAFHSSPYVWMCECAWISPRSNRLTSCTRSPLLSGDPSVTQVEGKGEELKRARSRGPAPHPNHYWQGGRVELTVPGMQLQRRMLSLR